MRTVFASSSSTIPIPVFRPSWIPFPTKKSLRFPNSCPPATAVFFNGPGGLALSLPSYSPLVCSSVAAGLPPLRSLGTGSTTPALLQDVAAAVLVMGGAYFLVLAFDTLTSRNLIDQKLSRKLVHILSGVLFMSSWPLFSTSMEARLFAAIVPLANCLRLIVYGLSLAKDEGLIKSVTRQGNPKELLKGPLYYVLMLLFCALVFWRDSPIGLISLAMMSGGDGFADILGRKFGSVKLPYNTNKSWVGSISMFIFGFLISLGMLYYYSSLGFVDLDWRHVVGKVVLVSFVATVVESLPVTDVLDDNIAVPLSTMLTALLIFG